MVCSDVVRECAGECTAWGWCHEVSYCGFYEEGQTDPNRFYHIPYCGEPMLNRIEWGGQIVWSASWMTAELFKGYTALLLNLKQGERQPIGWIHRTIDDSI